MNNFELIDDYLANRLKGQDKQAFEGQLAEDPALKTEVELQRHIVEGIRQARAQELKSMLSKVSVAGGAQVEFTVLRIAAGVLLAGAISAASYYYFQSNDFPPIENAAADVAKKEVPKQPDTNTESVTPKQDNNPEVTSPETDVKKSNKKNAAEITPATKPSLDLVDPSAELAEGNKAPAEDAANANLEISPAHIQVEADSSNKKYNFHYQFVDHKLMLYGSFDRSLFEVLELNGGNHALFLFHKNNFYVLDENQEDITKLSPIQDQALLRKLREYRK